MKHCDANIVKLLNTFKKFVYQALGRRNLIITCISICAASVAILILLVPTKPWSHNQSSYPRHLHAYSTHQYVYLACLELSELHERGVLNVDQDTTLHIQHLKHLHM